MAMSGGIDSSIAAMRLMNEGYELVGITIKTWDYALSGAGEKETGCCNLDTINDARAVAVKLGFPHYILDLKEEFYKGVVQNFIEEYLNARTPNPCVLCNVLIKWEALLKRAEMLDCNYIATGHYANVRHEKNRYILSKGKDDNKDQSYVLWGLSQQQLSRTLFPLGRMTKEDVRHMAVESGYDNLAEKKESYEICFIPDDDYRRFLIGSVPDINEKIGQGNFVDTSGKVLGQHKGFPFYTIGQRKGLNVAVGYPLYVKTIIPGNNTIVLGPKEELYEKQAVVEKTNLIKYESIPPEGLQAKVKIRYKHNATEASLLALNDEMLKIDFNKPVSAVTPGQSAVFYEGDDVIGGGIIK